MLGGLLVYGNWCDLLLMSIVLLVELEGDFVVVGLMILVLLYYLWYG